MPIERSDFFSMLGLAMRAGQLSFGEDGVPERYASERGDGRKDVSHSLSPAQLLRAWNWISWTVVLAVLAVIALVVLLVRLVLRRVRRKRKKVY